MTERWKRIAGYAYSVSSLGNVRNDKTGKLLSQGRDKDGYPRVVLYNGTNKWYVRVHKLVMTAFKPRKDESLVLIDHRDRDRSNNAVRNLRWATHPTNCANKVCNRTVRHNGRRVPLLSVWKNADTDVPYRKFYNRVAVLGWPVERALYEQQTSMDRGTKSNRGTHQGRTTQATITG